MKSRNLRKMDWNGKFFKKPYLPEVTGWHGVFPK